MPRFMKSLNNISRAQESFRRERLSELPPQLYSFVLAICRLPGSTQDELGQEICISKSVVSRRVDWLLERGYVTRISDEDDKRCMRIYPTDNMRRLLPQIRRINKEWTALITEGIYEAELEVFEDVLLKLEMKAREAAVL